MDAPRTTQLIIAAFVIIAFAGGVGHVRALEIREGQVKSLKLADRINTVAVGDAAIADARMAFDNTVLIIGRQTGFTNVIIYDDAGTEILAVPIAVLSAIDRQAITVIGGTNRRMIECEPSRCREISEPDQIIHTEVDDEGGSVREIHQ